MKERVALTVTLVLGGKEHAIPGGNVRALSLEMTSYGVSGTIEVVMQDGGALQSKYEDDLLDDFLKPDLGEVRLSFQPAHLETDTKAEDAKIATGGIVLDKELREEIHQRTTVEAGVVVSRRYLLRFVDPARALWRQHFPCALYTQKSFKDVIEAHKGDKITLTYDWDAITAVSPQIFFHLDPGAGASFYDLVVAYVAGRGGVLTYDHSERTYAIAGKKSQDGEAAKLLGEDVASLAFVFPEVPRHKARVLNSYAESPRTETADNANAATGIFHDGLLRTPIAKQVDDAVTAAKGEPLLPGEELEIAFRRFPTVAVAPGQLLDISTKGGHSAARRLPTEAVRVIRLSVEARALDQGPDRDFTDTATGFELTMTARVEKKSEVIARFPAYVAPRYPGHLEGKVVSEVGEDEDLTYQMNQDEETSVEQYKVKIPLFEDQIVTAPYEPHAGAGAIYFPLYKGERVLVALHFDRAYVARLLEWRADTRVPTDGQGQHVFFGKKTKASTSMLHDYQEDKPVLRVLRQNDKDTILFKMEEGKLTLRVEETKG